MIGVTIHFSIISWFRDNPLFAGIVVGSLIAITLFTILRILFILLGGG